MKSPSQGTKRKIEHKCELFASDYETGHYCTDCGKRMEVSKDDKFIKLRDYLHVTENLTSDQTLHIMTKVRELFK